MLASSTIIGPSGRPFTIYDPVKPLLSPSSLRFLLLILVYLAYGDQLQLLSKTGKIIFVYYYVAAAVVERVIGTIPGALVMIDGNYYLDYTETYLGCYLVVLYLLLFSCFRSANVSATGPIS